MSNDIIMCEYTSFTFGALLLHFGFDFSLYVQGHVFNGGPDGGHIFSVVLEGVFKNILLIIKRVVEFVAILNPGLGDDGYLFVAESFHDLKFLGVVVFLFDD